jgi:thiamine-monophosphate kinase
MAAKRKLGEFDLIARYFAPLAKGFPGADGLKSDNAFLAADGRHDLVVKTDTVVAGVHFLADERPEFIAAKALRVCLSDLAAGGAAPYAYQLSLALPPAWRERWVARFAKGLAADQRRYGIVLCGGDTVRTPGPLTVTVTAFGRVARRRGLTRSRARAGDDLWVSGTIGDGALGLLVARGKLNGAALERRYRLPQPRTALGARLVGIAHAAADVSDGLLADIGHIADASGVGFTLERELVPLSTEARRAVSARPALWASVLGGGDDYELVLAVPPRKRTALLAAARGAGVRVTRIGRFTRDKATPPRAGYVHF